MNEVPTKHRGGHSELLASAWLLSRGYMVFRNVSQHGEADLVAWRPGEPPEFFDVKSTSEYHNSKGHHISYQKLRPEQLAVDVKPIYVHRNGNVSFGPEVPSE